MIDQENTAPSNLSRPSRLLAGALSILAVGLLAAAGIALAYVIGLRIGNEKWPILVTAAGVATYVAISAVQPRHGLMLWIATAPFARFVHLNLDLGRGIPNLSLNRVMTGVLIILILAQLAIRRRRMIRLNLLDFAIVAFVAAGALSVPNALVGLKTAAQSFFDLLVVPVAIYFVARHLITSRQELRSVMILLMIVGVYLGLLATREQITGDVWFYPEDRSVQYTDSIRRVVGLLGNPAYIAVSIAMGVPWVWYLILRQRRHRLLLLGAVAIMMAGIYFCMNRSGWVGLLVALLTLALFVRRFRSIFILLVLVAAIVAGVYWAYIISSATVSERLTAQGPIDYRMETWGIALQMIRDNPVFGIGYDNFRRYYVQYGYWDVYLRATPTPHNTYLWVILMGGVVALAPFMLFLLVMVFYGLSFYYRAESRRRDLAQGRCIALAGGASEEDLAAYRDLAGTFLASMTAIWVPALVMDILTGYYNTMLTFLIIGAFVGVASNENWRLRMRRIVPASAVEG